MNAETNVLLTYQHTRSTREMLEAMLKRFQKREKDLLEKVKAEIAASPLVEVSRLEFSGIGLLVLTAKRRGLLANMIRTGVSASLPELKWTTDVTYTEPHSFVEGKAFVFEEVFAGALSLSGNTLPMAIPERMLEAGLLQEGAHNVDPEDRWTRVSDIFVGPELLQWRQDKFSTTLFLSEFGPGTRIFLRDAQPV